MTDDLREKRKQVLKWKKDLKEFDDKLEKLREQRNGVQRYLDEAWKAWAQATDAYWAEQDKTIDL